MNPTQSNKEVAKKTNPFEKVTDFLSENKQKETADGMNKVLEQAGEVQGSVAEVMAGMEAARENVSERNREDKRGDMRSTGVTQQSDDDQQATQQIRSGLKRRGEPSPTVMVTKIRTAINLQIKAELKNALKLEKNLTTGSAQEYNVRIAKIRRLKENLAFLFHQTIEKVKDLYYRHFGPDGRRKTADEL